MGNKSKNLHINLDTTTNWDNLYKQLSSLTANDVKKLTLTAPSTLPELPDWLKRNVDWEVQLTDLPGKVVFSAGSYRFLPQGKWEGSTKSTSFGYLIHLVQ